MIDITFVRLTFVQLRASSRKNKTKFIEKPLDELEATYDKQWLQDKVVNCLDLTTENISHVQFCSQQLEIQYRKALATLANRNWGQKGKPHPQDCSAAESSFTRASSKRFPDCSSFVHLPGPTEPTEKNLPCVFMHRRHNRYWDRNGSCFEGFSKSQQQQGNSWELEYCFDQQSSRADQGPYASESCHRRWWCSRWCAEETQNYQTTKRSHWRGKKAKGVWFQHEEDPFLHCDSDLFVAGSFIPSLVPHICTQFICCKFKDPTSGHQSSHCGLEVDWQEHPASRGSASVLRFTSDQAPSHSARLSSKAWGLLAPQLMESMPRRIPSVNSTGVWSLVHFDIKFPISFDVCVCLCLTSMHIYIYICICVYLNIIFTYI